MYDNPLSGVVIMYPFHLFMWFIYWRKIPWQFPMLEITLDPVFYDIPSGFGWPWFRMMGSQHLSLLVNWFPVTRLFKAGTLGPWGKWTSIPPVWPKWPSWYILFDYLSNSNPIWLDNIMKRVSIFPFWIEWSSLIINMFPFLLVYPCL